MIVAAVQAGAGRQDHLHQLRVKNHLPGPKMAEMNDWGEGR